MNGLTPRTGSRFLPLAMVIVIPLVVLTCLALGTLKQDEIQAHSQARREAERIAPQLAFHAAQALVQKAEEARIASQAWQALLLSRLNIDASHIQDLTRNKELPYHPVNLENLVRLWAAPEKLQVPIPEIMAPLIVWDRTTKAPLSPRREIPLWATAPWLSEVPPLFLRDWQELLARTTFGATVDTNALLKELRTLADSASIPDLRINTEFEALRLRTDSTAELRRFLAERGSALTQAGMPLVVPGLSELIRRWSNTHPVPTPSTLLLPLLDSVLRHPSAFNRNLVESTERALQARLGTNAPGLGPLYDLIDFQSRTRNELNRLDLETIGQKACAFAWLEVDQERRLACSLVPPGPQGKTGDGASDEASIGFTVLLPRKQVSRALEESAAWARLPEWAGCRFDVAGERFDLTKGTTALATSTSDFPPGLLDETPPSDGRPTLEVTVTLDQPSLLLAQVIRRQRTYGFLVLAVAATAILGLWQARRAFHRQLQLAEMRSGFVSSVSHELRAPIASIRLLAEGLDRGNTTNEEQRRSYLRFIIQECRRLSGLIENVLDYARIEQGRKDFEPEPIDATRLVTDTVRLMEPCAIEAGVSIAMELPPESEPLPQPAWDGYAIQQALVNLMDNAIKHSPHGADITVRLSLHSIDPLPSRKNSHLFASTSRSPTNHPNDTPDGRLIRIAITDHGSGIPSEEHARIFEQFYRRGSELRRETRGIGIGLSLARHTIEAHGGRILLESAPGAGSTFTIELPVVAPVRATRGTAPKAST